MEAEKKNPRQYSSAERADAVAIAQELGPTAASRKLGIPMGTVAYWTFVAKQKAIGGQKDAEPVRSEDATPDATVSRSTETPTSAPRPTVVKAGTTQAAAPVPGAARRRVAKLYTPSERARALEYAAAHGVTAAGREFQISRFSLHEWRRQTELHARGQAATSPVVGSDEDPAIRRDQRILQEWRAHPGLGPSQVRNQMRREGLKVSIHTVRCVLHENGYVPPKVRRDPVHDQLYEAVRPNHIWHLDFLHRHIHKQPIYVLLILDDYSRFIVGGAIWDGERVAAASETFEGAVARHGKPEKAMSDGGSAFYAWKGIGQFTRLLEELEVDQLIATIPQVNGKLEVLNANIAKELFNQEIFFDLGQAQQRLKAWIAFYNFRRTHHALGGLLVPADRYFGRAEEVLAQIEAGGTPDGLGEPIPASDRNLDIFRITSRSGQVEVHLMGQRLAFPVGK